MCRATTSLFSGLILCSAAALFCAEASAQERCKVPPDWEAPQTPDQRVVLGFDYPYERSQESYLFVNGMPYPYRPGNLAASDLMTTAQIRTGDGDDGYERVDGFMARLGLSPADMEKRTAVIGYGSNSAPSALTRKFVNVDFDHVAVFPVVKSVIAGFDVVYSPHLVFNGAMPATLARSADETRVQVYITWLDPDQLKTMDASEGVGEMYSYGKLKDVTIDLDADLELGTLTEAFIYIDCYGALKLSEDDNDALLAIRKVHAEKRAFEARDQRGATEAIIRLIGSNSDVDRFVCLNVQDSENRKQNTERLKNFRVPFEDERYTPDSGKACPGSLESLLGAEHIWKLEP